MFNYSYRGSNNQMANPKSYVAIVMGIIILIADVAWLIVGSSYTYTPWLVLGIVIFLASLIWLVVDISMMREGTVQKIGNAAKESDPRAKI
jgi:uncharacterized RDD family membrane protein YckC